ncbi:IucA/IucC family protein [Halomicrobium mukohataei]|uniref:IucA/IucC family protein n=2 Tax=Halomicrobium mukohataei TaxID=57705 RepID=C7P530_HALMD|nr:IucA/IucC family protein [Halomicrobium mukohataei]ACV49425.1 IucA/IucC family protein [Halomicrobium mukohataei DSM 12286]QCD67250.1 IucA/IucC family siderophore biosynthesis protein [Halomicrobium mukohataei]
MNANERARAATTHSFLNCYLRETGAYAVRSAENTPLDADPEEAIHVHFETQGVDLFVPLAYESPTGRHLFDLPGVYRLPDGEVLKLTYPTLVTLVTTELAAARSGSGAADELLLRVIQSCKNVERFVEARRGDGLDSFETTFLEAEQSLVFGHHLHPTPKSREGIPPHKRETYAPELGGSFRLHYFEVAPSLVEHGSALTESAPEWIERALRADDAVDESFVADHVDGDGILIPAHPWQADYLESQPHVREHLGDDIVSLGPVGQVFHPTSSVRTLYSPDAPFMVKTSLGVRITNSKRVNKRRELDRGAAITELFDTALGRTVDRKFPSFDMLHDPAYLTVNVGGGPESGFETVLRKNPYQGDAGANVMPVVALCQDGVAGISQLETIVRTLAEREGRTTEAVSKDWFEQYLQTAIRPVLWLYLDCGLGVEAHQQNGVLELEDGYPTSFAYRDSQGYYIPESAADDLDALLPGVCDRTDTVCPDAIADERVRYYVVLNNVFGVVNAFGTAGLVDERALLDVFRTELEHLRQYDHAASSLLTDLLTAETISCKANLLTRFHDMDELTGSPETQSVYTEIDNPLVATQEASQL